MFVCLSVCLFCTPDRTVLPLGSLEQEKHVTGDNIDYTVFAFVYILSVHKKDHLFMGGK